MRRLNLIALAVALLAGCAAPQAAPPPPDRPPPPATPPAALPKAPYATFDGTTFEPSAVAYDPATDRYLVLSDKDFILYRYALDDGRLVLPKGEFHRAL